MELSSDLSPHLKSFFDPIRARLTPYRFCWLLAGISFLIAWNRGIALLYAVVALTLAALLLSHVLVWANLRGLRVVREWSISPAPGEPPRLRYRLHAPGRRHFLLIQEPALPATTSTMVTLADGAAVAERELDHLYRGVYPLSTLRVSTAYPFGLLQRQQEFKQKPQRIVVYPKLHDIRRLPQVRAQAQTADAEVVAQRRRGWEEFAGIREQRPGESLKHIHWRASARENQLMVKEYESLDVPGMLIVLPQQGGFECGSVPHSSFEYAIEIAASLARIASREGHPVHCVSYGTSERLLQVPAHTVELSPMLEWFAHEAPHGTTPLNDAVERTLRSYPHPGWLVSFRLLGEAPPAVDPATQHLDFVFDPQSFRDPQAVDGEARSQPRPAPGRYLVRCHEPIPALFA